MLICIFIGTNNGTGKRVDLVLEIDNKRTVGRGSSFICESLIDDLLTYSLFLFLLSVDNLNIIQSVVRFLKHMTKYL